MLLACAEHLALSRWQLWGSLAVSTGGALALEPLGPF